METTSVLFLTGNQSLTATQYYDEVLLKSHSSITFDYTQLQISNANISRILIDPGDGEEDTRINANIENDHVKEPITYNFAKYNTDLPLTSITHKYKLPEGLSTDSISLSAKIFIKYSNYNVTPYIIPIKIYKSSYYDVIDNASILETQFIDNNDVFCIVETIDGDIINVVLS
jgi:hypothetical protein